MRLARLVVLAAMALEQCHLLTAEIPGEQMPEQESEEQVVRVELVDVTVVVCQHLAMRPCRGIPGPHVGAVFGFDLLPGHDSFHASAVIVHDTDLDRFRLGGRTRHGAGRDVLAVDVFETQTTDFFVERCRLYCLRFLLAAADHSGRQADGDDRSDGGIKKFLHDVPFVAGVKRR